MNDEKKSSRRSGRDHLTSTTKEGKIELTEEQLSRPTGGSDSVAGVFSPRVPLKVTW
jgi:hypothetical protein